MTAPRLPIRRGSRAERGVATSLEAREDLLADLGLSTSDLELEGARAGRYVNADPAAASAGAAIHMDLITEDGGATVACHRAPRTVGTEQ